MLRDKIFCGIQDQRTQCRLLAEPNLTLQKASKVSQAIESAHTQVKELQQKCMPLAPSSDCFEPQPERAHHTVLPSTTVHRHRLQRLITIHRLFMRLAPICRPFAHRSPLCNALLSSDVPYNHGPYARDADKYIGHCSVIFIRQLATVAANVDTSNLCVTLHPVSFVTVSRRARLLQSHKVRTRYIIGTIILIMFFSEQACRRHQCVSSSQSTVQHFVWKSTLEHQFHSSEKNISQHVGGKEKAATATF